MKQLTEKQITMVMRLHSFNFHIIIITMCLCFLTIFINMLSYHAVYTHLWVLYPLQAFKPVAGPMSSVTNTVTGPSVLSPPAASLPFGWSWQSGMYPFGMGSGSLPVPTTTFQEDDPLLEPGTNFTLPATVCQESKGGQSLHARSG